MGIPHDITSASIANRRRHPTLAAIAFLLPNLPLGIAGFGMLTVLLTVGAGTAIVWVGLPLLAIGLCLGRWLAQFERVRVGVLLGRRIETPYRRPRSTDFFASWRARLADPATWRDHAYLTLLLPVGVLEFVVLECCFATTVGLITLPIYYRWLPDGTFYFPGVSIRWLAVDSVWTALPFALLGVLCVPVAIGLIDWLASAHRALAVALLRPTSSSADRAGGRIEHATPGGNPIAGETDAGVRPPNPIKAIGFMIVSFPLRIIAFVLTVVLSLVGIGTSIVWAGVPILIGATALVNGFGSLERRWVAGALGHRIPPPDRPKGNGRPLRRWLASVTDSMTWREFGYIVLALPVGVVEFALGIASIVLFPLALWVVPWIGWLHGQWALSMLGPNRTDELAAKAEHLAASRARGVDAAEAERRRIERDLHDGAQQRLVAVAMGLGRAKSKMDSDPTGARVLIDEAHADAKQAIAELRDLARGIYPAVLGDRGLDAALSALAAKCPVPVTVEVAPAVTADPRPPTAVESTAYFICGEALTNIAKHAHARTAQIRLLRDADTVTVEVTDDGHGGAEIVVGGGLAGLADRAATIDGVVTVLSPLGGPTVLRADLPCAW